MIFGLPACCAGRPWQHNNRLTLNRKLQYRHKATPIIIRKGKGDMRIKVYEEQLEDGEKKKYKFMKESISRKWMQTSALPRRPAIHPQKEKIQCLRTALFRSVYWLQPAG